jgi:hypothetical protein
VLDNFRPLFLRGYEPDVGALHESIGYLLALFSALRHDALVRRLFEESGGDLRRPSVITRLAEEFGIGLKGGGFAFLPSSLDVLPYSDRAPADPHARSLIWTGAVYELMVRLVERALGEDPSFERFVAAVVEGSRWVRGMLIRALHYLPPSGVTLPQLARLVWEPTPASTPTTALSAKSPARRSPSAASGRATSTSPHPTSARCSARWPAPTPPHSPAPSPSTPANWASRTASAPACSPPTWSRRAATSTR